MEGVCMMSVWGVCMMSGVWCLYGEWCVVFV